MRLAHAALLLALLGAIVPGRADAADRIAIAHSDSAGSLPVRIATERGWWARVALVPRFHVFPSELPLMSAAGARAWDLAVVGIGSAVLGAARHDTTVIGLTTDRSDEVALFAGGLGESPTREQMTAVPTFANRGTTAALAAHACLAKLAIGSVDAPVGLVDRQPGDVARALESGTPMLGAVPSPFIEAVRRSGRVVQLCTAREAGLVVTDDIIVRHRFLERSPEIVARATATILRAVAWLQANPQAARPLLGDGAGAGDDAGELRRRVEAVTFDLEKLRRTFTPGPQGADIDRWHDDVAAIQRRSGAVREAPHARGYVDPSVLARIAADPTLRAFATLADRPD